MDIIGSPQTLDKTKFEGLYLFIDGLLIHQRPVFVHPDDTNDRSIEYIGVPPNGFWAIEGMGRDTLSYGPTNVYYPPHDVVSYNWTHNNATKDTVDIFIGCVDTHSPTPKPTLPTMPPVTMHPTFTEPGPLTPIDDHRIGYVDLTDEMHFEMDINVNSFLNSTCNVIQLKWVFRVYIFPSSSQQGGAQQGFTVGYPTGTSSTWVNVGDALIAEQTYHLEVDVTQNWVRIQIDGKIETDSSKASHTTQEDVPLYVSYDHIPCDVTVANILISSGIYCMISILYL